MDLKQKSFFETIEKRFSCRAFSDEKISQEQLDTILEAGRLAPTAVNFQPQKIYVVQTPALLEALKEATRYTFDAKTILVVCHDPGISWHRRNDGKDHGLVDSSIVATHMMLAATAIGLGSTYVCSFNDALVHQILDIPNTYEINCLLPLGIPKNQQAPNKRKNLEETIEYK